MAELDQVVEVSTRKNIFFALAACYLSDTMPFALTTPESIPVFVPSVPKQDVPVNPAAQKPRRWPFKKR